MNIVNKLTLRHLKENKGRTVITTLGICVSVAMITAVFVAIASLMNLFGEIELLAGGNKHASFEVNQQQLVQLKSDERFSKIGICVESDDYSSFRLSQRKSEHTGTGSFYTGDKANLEQRFTGEFDGTIPENENEIAVEQSLIEKNNLDWKVGDTVSIPVGYQYCIDEDGNELVINTETYGYQDFKEQDVKEYKITAILHDNPATMSLAKIVRGFDSNNMKLGANDYVTAEVELKEVNYKSLDVIEDVIEEYNIENYSINDDYLQTKFAIDKNSTLALSIIPMAAIVLVIIMIASVVLIYNAFGMSLSERVRYLGMLASVGATKKQKKLSVYYEGMVLGAVGIPVGILAGIAGIGITLKAIGEKIISTGMIQGISDSNVEMDVVVPLWAIVGIVLFSALTIFISSFIPSRKASHITPIDAIRQRNEIKTKAKSLKAPKVIRPIFGYEGELAYKNLKRNGRKSRVITASIALSVILFLSCNYFCSSFTRAINMEVDVPYQIQTFVSYSDKDRFTKELDGIAEIDAYYSVSNSYFELGKEYKAQDENGQQIVNDEFLTSTYKNLFNSKMYMFVNEIDDDAFNKLCQDNGIDYKEYYGDTVKALVMNNISHNTTGDKVFNDKLLGTTVFDLGDKSVVASAFVKYDTDNYVCNLNAKNTISVFVPLSTFNNVMYSGEDMDNISYMLGVETDAHEKVCEDIQNIFETQDFDSHFVMDYVETFQMMNTLVFVLEVFIYGFIALITLITVANIINTISTGIAMRRKEFAMLKSVGTTPKGFRKMVSLESVFYAIKALAAALPLSVIISYAMNKALANNVVPFEFQWRLYLAVIVVVFIIVGFTMLYAVSNLKNDSIVETLKEEIN